jgi:hypothetical protein
VSGYKDDRDPIVFCSQFALERQSAQVRQAYVEYEAGGRIRVALAKKFPGGGKRFNPEPN